MTVQQNAAIYIIFTYKTTKNTHSTLYPPPHTWFIHFYISTQETDATYSCNKLVNKIKLHYRTDRTRPGRTRPAGATST